MDMIGERSGGCLFLARTQNYLPYEGERGRDCAEEGGRGPTDDGVVQIQVWPWLRAEEGCEKNTVPKSRHTDNRHAPSQSTFHHS